MNGDATNSSNRRMDCDRVAREEILERYVVGGLSEEDQKAFEQHYFECARCFSELRALQAIHGELQRTGPALEAPSARPLRRWAPLIAMAAVLILGVGVVLSIYLSPSPTAPEEVRTQRDTRAQSFKQPSARREEPPNSSSATVAELARVEPPSYEPPTVRGAPDEATALFRRGMERYRKADYQGAVTDLSAAAKLDPDAAHIRFFLGISHLMSGQDNAAINHLRATIALGNSAYLEEAHFHLAKAFLRREHLGAAERELKRVIQLGGRRTGEARRLLTSIEKLERRPD